MKKRSLFPIPAILLALLLTVGCASGSPAVDPTDIVAGSGQLVLVDKNAGQKDGDAVYRPESPAIDSEPPLLPDGREETRQASGVSASPTAELASATEHDSLDLDFDGIDTGTDRTQAASGSAASKPEEVRSVWLSYLEMENLLKGKTESQFRKNMQEVFDTIKDFGLNTVILHTRPFGDALYQSDYFPWSYIITGTEGQNPGFDPFAIMVREARSRGLRVEAWVNPYRVRASGNKNALCADNPAQKWLDQNSSHVIRYNGAVSYNPASAEARALIINGVRELARNYDIDAIHIDDYFYPSTDAAFDASSYRAYQNGGGRLSLADWRRQNVETLIRDMYAAIKEENSGVLFGISPQSSIYNNYNLQYLDVEKIVSRSGYCDYICPQIYFGFDNDTQPFQETLEAWNRIIKTPSVELHIGIAAYKIGNEDNWAGSGKLEWMRGNDMLKRMVLAARGQSCYGGFVLYRYESLFAPAGAVRGAVQSEAESLKSLLR